MSQDFIHHDTLNRKRALDVTQSFIVQAPAGSGKTELITQRILNLLSTVDQPEEILALTFTKKAAEEMQERVINALHDAHLETPPKNPQHEQRQQFARRALQKNNQHDWNLLDNPSRLKIQTIDSFSAYLTQHLPVLSLLGGTQQLTEFPQPHYQQAVMALMQEHQNDVDVQRSIEALLLSLDNNLAVFFELMCDLLAKRDQWLAIIHDPDFNDKAHLSSLITESLQRIHHDYIQRARTFFSESDYDTLAVIGPFILNLTAANVDFLSAFTTPSPDWNDLATWKSVAHLCLTKGDEWRKKISTDLGFPTESSIKDTAQKQLFKHQKQALSRFIECKNSPSLKNILIEIRYLPGYVTHHEHIELLHHLFTLLKLTTAHLTLVFQKEGVIDFIENTSAAARALGNESQPTDLALYLDYHIKHILIDEFQDTSFTQLSLLKKLTQEWQEQDKKTVFIVGDPMQSIYKFRQAEVGIFIHLFQHGLPRIQLNPLVLHCNFRSTQTLIEWNNQCFNRIFPEHASASLGLVPFTPSVAINADSHGSEILIDEISSPIQGYVNHLVECVQRLQADYPEDSIGILVRSRTHVDQLIQALRQHSISFQAKNMLKFSNLPHIIDLLTLCKASLNPLDHFSWFALLRAPWCGLCLNDLLQLKQHQSDQETLMDVIFDAQKHHTLSPDGQIRLARLSRILKHQFQLFDRQPFCQWLYDLWFHLGGPAALEEQHMMQDIKTFIQLLKKIKANASTKISQIEAQLNTLYASERHASRIFIMTIHGSKGLEFDRVLLPALEKRASHEDKPLFTWTELQDEDNKHHFFIAARLAHEHQSKDSLYEFIHKKNVEKIKNEQTRLFYVAATRAKKGLYLSYWRDSEKESDAFSPTHGSLLHLIWPAIQTQRRAINIQHEPSEHNHLNQQQWRFDVNWKHPFAIPETTLKPQAHPDFLFHDNDQDIIGKITHRILENLALQGLSWWTHSVEKQLISLHRECLSFGLSAQLSARYSHFIVENITALLQNETAQWILAPHREAKSEFKFIIRHAEKLQTRIVDRVFIDEHNTRWLIDYKTSVPKQNESLAQFLKQEQNQYRSQLEEYNEGLMHMQDTPTKKALFFVFIPHFLVF